MSNGRKATVAFFFALWTGQLVVAQEQSSSLSIGQNSTAWFDEQIGQDHTGLVVGTYYEIRKQSPTTHPFFPGDKWRAGELDYRRRSYQNVNLLYNIFEDVLIIQHPTNLVLHNQPIRLVQEEVAGFRLGEHSFTNYRELPEPGFYEDLYLGDSLKLLSRRIKEERVYDNVYEFVPVHRYFLVYKGNIIRLRWKWQLLRILKPYRKELRTFIRSTNLKVRPRDGEGIEELIAYCQETLMQPPGI